MGTLGLVGLGLFYPFLWGPRLLPRWVLKVISVLYSQMECSAVWGPTVPRAVVPTSAPDVLGLPAVSSVSVSVFPSPTLVFINMDILCTYCMPSAMLHLWDTGVEEVAGVCPEHGTVQKLEFMESERRCLPGRVGHTYCGAQPSLPPGFLFRLGKLCLRPPGYPFKPRLRGPHIRCWGMF